MAEQGSQGFFSPFLRRTRIEAAVPFLQGEVLDIGCGAGHIASFVSPDRYCGVDISEDALRAARTQFPQHKFSATLPEDRRFDTVVALAVIEHVKQPASFLQTMGERLKKTGGQLVLTTPHPAFRKVHDFGASLGIFSHDASEEHETFLDRDDMEKHGRSVGLQLETSRRFLFGANQLFILRKPAE